MDAAVDMRQLRTSLATAHNRFGMDLYGKLAAGDTSNLLISPLSVAMCLQMATNGAAGDTRAAMEAMLYLKNLPLDQANEANSDLLHSLTQSPGEQTMHIANGLFAQNGFLLVPSTLITLQRFYQAEVQNVDFADLSSVHTINNWVSSKTGAKITRFIERIQTKLGVAILNAIYFKGAWQDPFRREFTAPAIFHGGTGDTQVQMMQRQDAMPYFEDDSLQLVAVPYAGDSLRMLVFLPKPDKLADFESKVAFRRIDNLSDRLSPKDGTLMLPRFKVEWGADITGALESLGMKAQQQDGPDFSLLSPNKPYISTVIHKTFMEVNEEGTEAAAATGMMMEGGCAPSKNLPFVMNVDRPFFVAIQDTTTRSIIFFARVMTV
jgi:serpin B